LWSDLLKKDNLLPNYCFNLQAPVGPFLCGGTEKFLKLLKKNYLKYLYKFETLVPFEVLPLRLDAAIPAPLPMLEILSKIFNINAVKGHQRIAGGPSQHLY